MTCNVETGGTRGEQASFLATPFLRYNVRYMEGLYKRWKRAPERIRKITIFLIGFATVGIGIILLPLPGPGWAIIFIGFAILASEFEFAERVRDRLVHTLKELIALSKRAWHKLKRGFDKWMQS